MLVSVGLDLEDLNKTSYNRSLKANIPKYNIKASKTKDMVPFMSPKHLQDVKISNSKLSNSGLNSPNKKGDAPKKLTKQQEKELEEKLEKLRKEEELQQQIEMQKSQETLSGIHIDE